VIGRNVTEENALSMKEVAEELDLAYLAKRGSSQLNPIVLLHPALSFQFYV